MIRRTFFVFIVFISCLALSSNTLFAGTGTSVQRGQSAYLDWSVEQGSGSCQGTFSGTQYPSQGDGVYAFWTSSHASSGSINGTIWGNSSAAFPQTYTLACTDNNSLQSDSATLTVTDCTAGNVWNDTTHVCEAPAPAPTANLTITPAGPLTYPVSVNYNFTSNGAGSCYVYDQSGYVYITKASNQTSLNATSSTGYGTITIYYQCWSGPNGAGTANTLASQTITINCPNGTTWNGTNACTPNSVNDCSAQTKTWNTNCSGSVSATTNGNNSSSVSNTAVGYTGSATFSCSNTVFTVNPGATCSVAAGASCPLPWGGSIADGASVTAYQAATGNPCVSQTRTCTNGNLSGSYTFQSCSTSGGPSCPSQTVSWGAGCSGTVAVTNDGVVSSSVNNTAGSYSGSATFLCSNSAYAYVTGSCTYLGAGALTVNPSSCTLGLEESSCPSAYSWSTGDADAWIQFRFFDGTLSTYANATMFGGGSSGNISRALYMDTSGVSSISEYRLRSTPGIGTTLASQAVSVSCQSGLHWGGAFCTDNQPRIVLFPNDCVIANNGTSCIGYMRYSTANISNLVITDSGNVTMTPTVTGTYSGYVAKIAPMTLPYGTHSFNFKDGSTLIKSGSVSATCDVNLAWDGAKCAASCAVNQFGYNGTCYSCPSGATSPGGFVASCTCPAGYSWDSTNRTCAAIPQTISATPNPCYITRGQSTCSTDLSWTTWISNARVDVNGAVFSNLENATSVPATMNYGSNTIYLRNQGSGNVILHSINVLAQCTGSDTWDSATCVASNGGNADLTVGTIAPTTVTVNNPTPLQATIQNIAGASTGASFSNYIQVRTAGYQNVWFPWNFVPAGTPVDLAPVTMGTLAGNTSSTTLQTYTFPTTAGYEARACADLSSSADVVGIINEGGVGSPGELNNCGAWTAITVSAASGGQISASPNPCYIARGASTCASTISWNTFTFVDVLYQGVYLANNAVPSGSVGVTVPYSGVFGAQTATLFDSSDGSQINQVSLTAMCTGADVWVAGECAAVSAGAQNIDLQVGISNYIINASAGTPIDLTKNNFIIYNMGTNSGGSPFASHLKIATGPSGTGNQSEIDYIWTPTVPAVSTTTSAMYTFPSAGTYSVKFCVDKPTSAPADTNGTVVESNETNNCSASWIDVTVGAAGPTLTTGTLIATPTTCTLTHGQGSCPVSFDWTTALQEDPVSQVVADINPSDNASGPDSTSLLLADTEILNVRRTGPTGQVFRLYNNTHDIAQATVTADCSVNTRLDTLSNLCVDPQVSSVTVSGQHYYSSPEQFTLTCFQSNAYKVLKNGSTFVATTTLPNLPSQVVTISPTQPSSVNGDTYTFMCIYGNVGSNPQTTTSYDSSAPLIPDIFIDAYPKTINANGKSVISWSITRPRLSAPFCAMTVSAVCTNNTCTQSQTQAAQQLQNTINTGKIDGSNTITIADAVKSVALGQVGINAKALGKKTLTASTTVDFKITCGAQSATTRVRVANSKEQ